MGRNSVCVKGNFYAEARLWLERDERTWRVSLIGVLRLRSMRYDSKNRQRQNRWLYSEVAFDPGVGGVDQFFGGAVEDYVALVEDEELYAGVDALFGAVFGDGLHAACRGVVAVGGHDEGVLEAVGDDERGGVLDVALLHDELDDGGGGDGVEAAGGGVVEDEVGAGDDGAGDGDAAAHASGELGGVLGDGGFEFDEFEGFDYAAVGLFGGDVLFVEAIGYVVFDVEGVEEGGLLEDHADLRAELVEVALGHGGDLLAEDADGAGVGAEEAIGELEQDGFSGAGGAEDDEGLAAVDGEGDVFENDFLVEGEGDVFEDDDGAGVGGDGGSGLGEGFGHGRLAAEDTDHGAGDQQVDDDDED